MPSTVMGLSAGISIGGKKAGISIEYGVASQVLLPQSQPEAIAVEMTAPIINNLDADLEFMLTMNFYFTVQDVAKLFTNLIAFGTPPME